MGKVLVGAHRRPRGRRRRPFIEVPLSHTCVIHVWYSGREKEIVLSRAHPKWCDRLRMRLYSLWGPLWNTTPLPPHRKEVATSPLIKKNEGVVENNVEKSSA